MEHDIKLSLLICHLEQRDENLKQLMDVLSIQIKDNVEVVINTDRGEMPVGEKRNQLLEDAKGEYVAYIDDDDLVSDDYVECILDSLKSNPDCVGIEGILYTANAHLNFKHSIQFAGWYQVGGVFYRTPNHLNPIKKDIAKRVGFDASKSVGEDKDYSSEVRKFLRTEVYIEKPIYFYNCLHVVVNNGVGGRK